MRNSHCLNSSSKPLSLKPPATYCVPTSMSYTVFFHILVQPDFFLKIKSSLFPTFVLTSQSSGYSFALELTLRNLVLYINKINIEVEPV